MDTAQVKQFFERVAGQWDQMHQGFNSTDVIDALAEHSALGPAAHVVDVGTGTGFIAAGLASRTARVTGTDTSPAMLAQARSNLTELDVDNVELLEAPVSALPLANNSADATVANMVAPPRTRPGRHDRRDGPGSPPRQDGRDHRLRRARPRVDAHRAGRFVARIRRRHRRGALRDRWAGRLRLHPARHA